MAKDPTPQQWAASVLQRLGFKQSPGAVQALVGWAKAEGGHYNNDARYNLLNTTQPEPGAGNTGTQGNIKVYRSWDQGIDATVTTLKNGHYGGILQALKKGDPGAVASAIDASPWGTHGRLVYDAIGAAQPAGDVQPYGGAPAVPHGASAGTPAVPGTPGVDNTMLRRQLVGQFLQQGGVANPQAVLSLAGSYGQAQDVPGTAGTPGTAATPAAPSTPRLKTSGLIPLGGSKNAGKGAFDINGPNPDRLKPELVSFADKVASVYGGSLVGSDGSTHSKYTVNGNVSEHYTGNATDIFTIGGQPAQGKVLLKAGRAALIAAGMPRAQALKAQGGLYNVGNHQVIFLTNEGGNHFDHLHISTHAS